MNKITGNISTIIWGPEYCYYELLTRLHLLLVKNNLRKAYFDKVTLINCKYFENCPDEQIDNIILTSEPSFGPGIDALNQLQKVCKTLGLRSYMIKQIPIEVRTNCDVPESVVSEFATSFSCGKQIFVFNSEEIESEIKKLVTGELQLGDILEYPQCCIQWMMDTKTESLEDCYKFFIKRYGEYNNSDEAVEFLHRNFESDIIPRNEDRMNKIQNNHVAKTISVYPFVFHQACDLCLKNPSSPTAKLNNKYEKFVKMEVPEEFYREILEAAAKITKIMKVTT